MRRRLIHKEMNNGNDALYPLKSGSFTSKDGSIVTISDSRHIYAKAGSAGGQYLIWLSPPCTGYSTSIYTLENNTYPKEVLFNLKIGDVIRFVITNNNTAITNQWQPLYVGFAVGTTEKIISGSFQRLTEITTEVIVEEDIGITALFVRISRMEVEAEFDLEVYVNDVRYF